jgi:hypothetical protein
MQLKQQRCMEWNKYWINKQNFNTIVHLFVTEIKNPINENKIWFPWGMLLHLFHWQSCNSFEPHTHSALSHQEIVEPGLLNNRFRNYTFIKNIRHGFSKVK